MRTVCFRAVMLALPLLLMAGSADAQKLYRWVDKDGKVHYSDQVPPSQVDQARQQLNDQGRPVEKVDRALTPEEQAAALEQAKVEEARRKLEEDQAKQDAILIGSYQTEGDLERSYQERFDLVGQSVESAQIGIKSQEKSLADLLAHAAGLEQQGKPVPNTIKSSIDLARSQVEQQREYLQKREAEQAALKAEYETKLARYRELKGKSG